MTTESTLLPTAARAKSDVERPPRLSVVVVSYNCRPLVRECLTSLAAQTIAADLQVVVVDNASADGTPEMIRTEFPWVTLLANSDNEGFGRASNAGLRQAATSGHVLMLNPDTVLPVDALARALEALDQRPDVGVLGVRLVQLDGAVDHASRRQIPTPSSSLAYLLRLRGRGASAYTDLSAFDTEGAVGAVNGAFMLIRDQAVRDVCRGDGALFDEAFWMYGEDLDLCLRVTRAGWRVYYWPGVDVVHVKGGSSGRMRTLRVNRAFHSAMWIFYRKHYRSTYGPGMTVLVATGISAKFLLSTIRSALVRTLRSLRPTTRTTNR